jgi:hypothetical protein
MCCEPNKHSDDMNSSDQSCGCCCGQPQRRFLTKKEKIQILEKIKEDLENELEGVKERIKDLSAK